MLRPGRRRPHGVGGGAAAGRAARRLLETAREVLLRELLPALPEFKRRHPQLTLRIEAGSLARMLAVRRPLELEAVRLAWVNAVQRTASGDDPDGMAFWHDRYLAPLVQRLPSLYRIKTCRRDHQDPPKAPVTDRGHLPGV